MVRDMGQDTSHVMVRVMVRRMDWFTSRFVAWVMTRFMGWVQIRFIGRDMSRVIVRGVGQDHGSVHGVKVWGMSRVMVLVMN